MIARAASLMLRSRCPCTRAAVELFTYPIARKSATRCRGGHLGHAPSKESNATLCLRYNDSRFVASSATDVVSLIVPGHLRCRYKALVRWSPVNPSSLAVIQKSQSSAPLIRRSSV